MTELSLGLELIGAVVGISALNVGVIMVYIKMLHTQTCKDLDEIKEDLYNKSVEGIAEHESIWYAITKISRNGEFFGK